MCTNICVTTPIRGSGKSDTGWFPVVQANVGFDHASHTQAEHALLLDFVNPSMGVGARVALEMDLASGRALLESLRDAIDAAEKSGVSE